jgi:hypothetical protein
MNNKLILSLTLALGIFASHKSDAQSLGATTFVDVATLGTGVTELTSTGSVPVAAAKLTTNQRWTRDRVYILSQTIVVPDGVTLTIEPGTLIRAERTSRTPSPTSEAAVTPADPGSLVVARGGKLIAVGTADAPIIFTSIDDVNVPGGAATVPPMENKGKVATGDIINGERTLRLGYNPDTGTPGVGLYTISGGTLNTGVGGVVSYDKTWRAGADSAFLHEGRWGGIVLCGKGTLVKNYASGVNALTDTGVVNGYASGGAGKSETPVLSPTSGSISSGTQKGTLQVEGMAGFAGFSYGGGDDDLDTSGALRFVSNRYGGFIIASGKELNSYSFYGVGSNTVLEFLEGFNNQDDDFEFWGGSPSMRYAMSAFAGDDGLDTDCGFLGAIQYFVQIQNNGIGVNGTSLSGRPATNFGDSLTENDGPEGHNSAVPYSTYTLANATLIGRGYGAASYSGGPFAGPNFKDNAGARTFNSLIMDNPHGAVYIMDRKTVGTAVSSAGDSSINRFTGTRTGGGFDAAGRASDLTTPDTGNPAGPDGVYNNCWFFRNGYADTTAAGIDGKHSSLENFKTEYDSGLVAATSGQMFPSSGNNSERGASGTTTFRANTGDVITELTKAGNYNSFNVNPGVVVDPFHRISGINLASARDLANSALPSYRGINNDATFVGAVRHNMWMRGWTMADQLGVFSGSAINPEVVLSVDTNSKPVITFGADSGKKYVVEYSTDNKTYSKVQTVEATETGNKSVTDSLRTVGSGLLLYRVITL